MAVGLSVTEVREAAASLHRIITHRVAAEGATSDVESFVILARAQAELLHSLWESFRVGLSRGIDAAHVRTQGASLATAADVWLPIAQALLEAGEQVAQRSSTPVKGLSELAAEVTYLRDILAAVRTVIDAVNAAGGAPLDPKKLEEAEAAFAQGRYKKGKDVIVRLRCRTSS